MSRPPFNGFRYCLDPVFLTVAGLYLLNRFAIKPHVPLHAAPLFTCYVNDLLCIPFCLPPVLYVYARLGIRHSHGFPTAGEIASHVLIWSVMFEWLAPQYFHRHFPAAVSDPLDVVCYVVGALLAGAAWGCWRRLHPIRTVEARP